MEDDEVLWQSVEMVLRVAHNLSKPRIFIHLYSISSIPLNHSLSLLVLSHGIGSPDWVPAFWCEACANAWFLKNFFCFPYAKYILFKYPQWVLAHWVLYSQHPMSLITHFIFLTYLMPFDNGILLTFNAIYTGGVSSQYVLFKYPQWVLPHWVSYSRHPMPLSDTGVQAICLSRQSDPLNCLPHFWCSDFLVPYIC